VLFVRYPNTNQAQPVTGARAEIVQNTAYAWLANTAGVAGHHKSLLHNNIADAS